jgi:hypothetical protein
MFSTEEINYQIYHREILTIEYAMMRWRCYHKGVRHPTTVFSEHMNLQ